jgi:cystathionine beta-lyase/cystathionine gamma-synthase
MQYDRDFLYGLLLCSLISASNDLVLSQTELEGVHTTAERRARWGGDAIPEGFIRLSAGCEDMQDLLEDLAQAFAMISIR